MKNCVFVHTNHRQMVGALVSQYSLKRNSRDPDAFDVRIIDTKDHPFLHAREGQHYLRDGVQRQWLIEDLQSFTPLRFMPPELMGYQGRAMVIDPDVFAVGDVNELLTRDMEGKALMCRARKGPKSFASSVMLLDCARLTHWRTAEQFDEMFEFKRDYMDWICLKLEPRETHRPARARVERLRPPRREHQAPAQHQALEPALEDRACRSTSRPSESTRHLPPARLDPPGPRQPVRPLRPARAVQAALGPEPGALLLRPPARMPGQGRDLRGDAARGDGAQPRAPRRVRGAGADAAPGGLSRRSEGA